MPAAERPPRTHASNLESGNRVAAAVQLAAPAGLLSPLRARVQLRASAPGARVPHAVGALRSVAARVSFAPARSGLSRRSPVPPHLAERRPEMEIRAPVRQRSAGARNARTPRARRRVRRLLRTAEDRPPGRAPAPLPANPGGAKKTTKNHS